MCLMSSLFFACGSAKILDCRKGRWSEVGSDGDGLIVSFDFSEARMPNCDGTRI